MQKYNTDKVHNFYTIQNQNENSMSKDKIIGSSLKKIFKNDSKVINNKLGETPRFK